MSDKSSYLYFKVHKKVDKAQKCFYAYFIITLLKSSNWITEHFGWSMKNEPLWDIDLSKLSLHSMADGFNKKIIKNRN